MDIDEIFDSLGVTEPKAEDNKGTEDGGAKEEPAKDESGTSADTKSEGNNGASEDISGGAAKNEQPAAKVGISEEQLQSAMQQAQTKILSEVKNLIGQAKTGEKSEGDAQVSAENVVSEAKGKIQELINKGILKEDQIAVWESLFDNMTAIRTGGKYKNLNEWEKNIDKKLNALNQGYSSLESAYLDTETNVALSTLRNDPNVNKANNHNLPTMNEWLDTVFLPSLGDKNELSAVKQGIAQSTAQKYINLRYKLYLGEAANSEAVIKNNKELAQKMEERKRNAHLPSGDAGATITRSKESGEGKKKKSQGELVNDTLLHTVGPESFGF